MDENIDIFKTVKFIVEKLSSLGSSWTITIQNGEDAGQTIPHLHVHVIPRNKCDLKNNNDIYN